MSKRQWRRAASPAPNTSPTSTTKTSRARFSRRNNRGGIINTSNSNGPRPCWIRVMMRAARGVAARPAMSPPPSTKSPTGTRASPASELDAVPPRPTRPSGLHAFRVSAVAQVGSQRPTTLPVRPQNHPHRTPLAARAASPNLSALTCHRIRAFLRVTPEGRSRSKWLCLA